MFGVLVCLFGVGVKLLCSGLWVLVLIGGFVLGRVVAWFWLVEVVVRCGWIGYASLCLLWLFGLCWVL